jgi:hypothetical protein
MASKEVTGLFCLLLLVGCVMTPRTRQPLLDQEIRVRPEGFVNQVCTQFDQSGKCLAMDKVIYDLTNKETRDRLIQVKLICNISGQRFRIMQDEACVYRTEYQTTRRFIGIPTKKELVVLEKLCMPKDLQTLLDRKAYCAAYGSASERGMKWN